MLPHDLYLDRAFLSRVEAMQSVLSQGQFREALEQCERILREYPDCVPALIAVSVIAQLSGEEETPRLELDHARYALKAACEIEAMGGSADHEYGRYLFSVEDDTKAALEVFSKGIERRKAELCELTLARIEALIDAGRSLEAESELSKAENFYPDIKKLMGKLA